MRVNIALALFVALILLAGCAPPHQAAYTNRSSSRWQHAIKASSIKPPARPSRPLPKSHLNAGLAKSSPLPSSKSSKLKNAELANPPPLPKTPKQAQPRVSPTESQITAAPVSSPTKHYVVVDPIGICAVLDAKPADGLKIVGNREGYASSEAAHSALKVSKAECNDTVGVGAESKFKAAQAKAKKLGLHELTREDIDGLSSEQIKQLRGY